MAILQVKGMDDALYQALRARAATQNRSISQEVITLVQESLGRPVADPRAATAAFLELAGSWGSRESAKELVRKLRQARRSRRRRKDRDVFA